MRSAARVGVIAAMSGLIACGGGTVRTAPLSRVGPDGVAMDPAVGWYRVGGDREVLLSPGADGALRLLDFAGLEFHRLDSLAGGQWRVRGQGHWDGAVLRRDNAGNPTELVDSAGVSRNVSRTERPPYRVEEIRFQQGRDTLAALRLVPHVRKLVGPSSAQLREVPIRLPAVVIIHGSGDSDRDNIWAYTFADAFAQRGFVTILPDKRGSGHSAGAWRRADFHVLAADAAAAVAALRRDPRVDPARIGVVGLSQGGWVAPSVAVGDTALAFVVAVSASATTPFEQVRHEVRQDLIRADAPAVVVNAVFTTMDALVAHVRQPNDSAFARYLSARAALVAAAGTSAATGFPVERDAWQLSWWAGVGDVDPVIALRRIAQPVLVLYGADDERDNVPVAESMSRLARLQAEGRDLTVRVLEGSGHTLTSRDRGWVRLDALDDMTNWALQRVHGLDGSAQR